MGPNQPHYGYYGEQKKKPPYKIIALIIGVLILVFVAIGIFTSISKQNSIGTQSQHIAVRLNNLTTLTSAASKDLRSDDLQKINTEVSIITAGVQANLASTLPKKADKSIVADESDASDTTSLANAKLAGTYDTEYKKVLEQKLDSITALLMEMYNKTHSDSLKTAINDDYKNYETLMADLQKTTL